MHKQATVKTKSYKNGRIIYEVLEPGEWDGEPILDNGRSYDSGELGRITKALRRYYMRAETPVDEPIKFIE